MALAKRLHCQIYHIFLARSQGSCALEEKNLQMPRAMSGRGWVMIRVSTSYLHIAVLIGEGNLTKGGSFYLFIVLLSTTIIIHKMFLINAPLDTLYTLSSGIAACQLVLNFRERVSIQHT